jgi:hypothetical protein
MVIGLSVIASAQDQKTAPSHVHYKEPAQAQQASPDGAVAPRLQKLGNHKFPVSTKNAQAQLFMNQRLNLSYAFNHAEAGRAYREAERLDPNWRWLSGAKRWRSGRAPMIRQRAESAGSDQEFRRSKPMLLRANS